MKAYATLGEICDALRAVFGVYEEVAITWLQSANLPVTYFFDTNILIDFGRDEEEIRSLRSWRFWERRCKDYVWLVRRPRMSATSSPFRRRFSAALDFLESSCPKVTAGANPRKNDPGLYIDFQLLLYLGDDGLSFLTNENFAHEIRKSPQRQRIIRLDSL